MNLQAIMKIQKEMMKAKNEIDSTIYNGSSNFVSVEVDGTKNVKKITIDKNSFNDKDDIEMIEDMITIAINDAMKKVDDDTEKKLGKYTKGMPGLF